MMDLDRGSP